jgi:hypothetical protein
MPDEPGSNPHDALFKDVFGARRYAAAHFRRFLAPELASQLDAATLEPSSYVDEAMRTHHADLVWSVPWLQDGEAEAARAPAVRYPLFEHQSTSDSVMPWRRLRYMSRIWDDWGLKNPGARRLPVILPIVLYHGASPWSGARRHSELLDVPDALRPFIEPHSPDLELVLQDLPRMDDATLGGGSLDGIARLLLARGRQASLLETLQAHRHLFRAFLTEQPEPLRFAGLIVRYVFEINDEVAPDAVVDLVGELDPVVKEYVMNGVEKLRKEGEARGVAKGARLALLKQIALRYGAAAPAVETRVLDASDAQVDLWLEAILTAPTLDALLATAPR